MDYKQLIKTRQQTIVLVIGFLLVGGLGFGLGKITTYKYSVPTIKVEQAFAPPDNYTPSVSAVQSETSVMSTSKPASGKLDCTGKIKGASSLIYHVPGDAFYKRTMNTIRCFDAEAQAQAAGFRKSSK